MSKRYLIKSYREIIKAEEERRRANLQGANLREANLQGANLQGAYLQGANLREANLQGADLQGAYLQGANLQGAYLQGAYLQGANLQGAYLQGAYLQGANLSGVIELISPSQWMKQNFEQTKKGYVVYKKIGHTDYDIPKYWKIKKDSFLEEVVNPLPTSECACGVNFGTLKWCQNNYKSSDLWKCLIHWEDLPSVVVPYNSDGKARCERLQLLKIIKEEKNND